MYTQHVFSLSIHFKIQAQVIYISYHIVSYYFLLYQLKSIQFKKQKTRLLIYTNTHCANAPNERMSADQDQVFPQCLFNSQLG